MNEINIYKKIGQKIKKSREELDLNQPQLAKLTNYSVPAICQIENGNIAITLDSLLKISKALRKPVDFFLSNKSVKSYQFTSKLIHLEQQLTNLKSYIRSRDSSIVRERVHIAVGSNVKSMDRIRKPLITALGKQFHAKIYPEQPKTNPFMIKFFNDKKKWAFHSQIFFFKENIRQQAAISKSNSAIIQGRTIYENFNIFVKTLYSFKKLTTDEFSLLKELYEQAFYVTKKPDVIIYVRSDPDKLWHSLSNKYKKIYPLDYVRSLHDQYEKWVQLSNVSPIITITDDPLNGKKLDNLYKDIENLL